ncbi:MAG: TonB-dependent receptor family protein [Bacteroidales bacterium]|nr:TonB-dependent receptor family protein [Bacteroidales bacterium]
MKFSRVVFGLLLGLPLIIKAQHCSLSGKVIDGTSGDFLIYSTIKLLNISDSSIYKGTIPGVNGSFFLQDIIKGEYICCISHIGYQEKFYDIAFLKEKQHLDLETITLFPSINTLSEVEISTQNRVTTKFDRTIYHIDSSLLAGTTSTIDVLKKIPDLFVDQVYDAVNIKGMSNTMVMLNGVLNPAETKLKSIDPQAIEKIEIITNPSSEYDSDVEGIVNIILKEERDQGFIINFDGNYLAPLSRIGVSPSFIYNWKRVQYHFSYDYYLWKRKDRDTTYRNFTENEKNHIYSSTSTTDKYTEQSHDICNRLDYYINKNNFISFSFLNNFNSRTASDDIFATNHIHDSLMNTISTHSQNTDNHSTGNYTFFYRKIFAKKEDHKLTVNFNFHNMKAKYSSEYDENKTFDNSNFISKRNETINASRYSYNFKMDYYHPVLEKFTYNVGALGYYQMFNNRFDDGGKSDTVYQYSNLKTHAYLDLVWKIKKFDFRLGNKIESYSTYMESEPVINTMEYLPSFTVSRKFLNHHQLNFNFRTANYYPSVWMLTPYITYSADSSSASVGNSGIKPQTHYLTSLTYLLRKNNSMLRIIASYSYMKNMFVTQNIISEQNILMRQITNMPGKSFLSLAMIYAYDGDLLSVGGSVTPFFEYFTHPHGYRDNTSCRVSLYSYWYLPLDFDIDVDFSYGGHKNLTPNGYYAEKPELNVYLSKNILKGDIKIMLGYTGLFIPKESVYVTDIENLYEWRKYTSSFRGVYFRFQYYLRHGKKFEKEQLEKYIDNDVK